MLDNTPSQPDLFERQLSPQAAKIYRTLVTATRSYEPLALGVLAEISALGLRAQFESALERAPDILINAPAKDSSVQPTYWNFIHEVALRVFHPTANILNDSQINPLIGLAAINLKFFPNDSGSRRFMARFIASFIENITARHRGEHELTAEQRPKNNKVPDEIAKQAVLDIGDLQRFAKSIITEKADTALFNRLDAAALAALSKGLITECTNWEFLLNAGGEATLSAADIEELHNLVNARVASAKTPSSVTRLYLSTTLGLWTWGNHWERDRVTFDLDPREPLLQRAPSSQGISFSRFLIESLPAVADFIDLSFNDEQARSRYSGKVGQVRFMSDMRERLDWVMALRVSPFTLLESWRAVRKLNDKASISTAAVVAFCSKEFANLEDILQTAESLLEAGLAPQPGRTDFATLMLSSGLLMDIARIGINQAVQSALDSLSPPLSLASRIPAVTIDVNESLNGNNAAKAEAEFSLITDQPPSNFDKTKERLKDVTVILGHQPGMTPLVLEVLKLYPDKPEKVHSGRYMEALADVLRFAEVIIRRGSRPQVNNAKLTETNWVSAPPSIVECLRVAHQWTKHFGTAVYPTTLGLVLTAAAGRDLREIFPNIFKGQNRPDVKDIAAELTTWRKELVLDNKGQWPLKDSAQARNSKHGLYGLGINQELFSSSIGDQPPKFRFALTNTSVAQAFKLGGLRFSIPFFLPDPLPLPYTLDQNTLALEKSWPDQSLRRYLVRHATWRLFYSQPIQMRQDLIDGQCYLPASLRWDGVSKLSVRKATGAVVAEEQRNKATELLADLNHVITDDVKISREQALAEAKQTLVEQIANNLVRMRNKALVNPQIDQGIRRLTEQMQSLANANSPKALLEVLAHTKFRLITASSLRTLQTWLTTFVPADERQNISDQAGEFEANRRGIVRLMTGVDSITRCFLAELAPANERELKAAEGLLDIVLLRDSLNTIYTQLAQVNTEDRVDLYMHSSIGYELSIAGLIADTCAISELEPQRKNANIACIPFIMPSQPINQPLFMGNALIFGVILGDGSGSILIRPLNPSEYYLEHYSAEDIVEGLFDDIKARVIASGEEGQQITSITIPLEERSGGVLSNRPDVVAYLKKRYFSKPEQYPRTSLSNPRAAVYRDAEIAGELVVVRSW